MAGSQARSGIVTRFLHDLEDIKIAVDLQQQIWGFKDYELLPPRLFVVATKIGGQVFGAYDGSKMVGFCLSIPGVKPGLEVYLHSHMLGVTAEYRNAGVGRLLKLAQRDEALSRDFRLMEWTFDPLEIKNAYFNMVRLGAVVRRHVYNQYGITSSRLHGGLPTDRLTAEWYINSARVKARVDGWPLADPPIQARIAVPSNIEQLRVSDPERTREIQKRISDEFQHHFAAGLAVVGVERTEEAGVYLLAKWDSKLIA